MFTIFQKLGGQETALEIIALAVGKKPSPAAIQKWREIGFIPPHKAVHLLDACQERGISAQWRRDCVRMDREAAE